MLIGWKCNMTFHWSYWTHDFVIKTNRLLDPVEERWLFHSNTCCLVFNMNVTETQRVCPAVFKVHGYLFSSKCMRVLWLLIVRINVEKHMQEGLSVLTTNICMYVNNVRGYMAGSKHVELHHDYHACIRLKRHRQRASRLSKWCSGIQRDFGVSQSAVSFKLVSWERVLPSVEFYGRIYGTVSEPTAHFPWVSFLVRFSWKYRF